MISCTWSVFKAINTNRCKLWTQAEVARHREMIAVLERQVSEQDRRYRAELDDMRRRRRIDSPQRPQTDKPAPSASGSGGRPSTPSSPSSSSVAAKIAGFERTAEVQPTSKSSPSRRVQPPPSPLPKSKKSPTAGCDTAGRRDDVVRPQQGGASGATDAKQRGASNDRELKKDAASRVQSSPSSSSEDRKCDAAVVVADELKLVVDLSKAVAASRALLVQNGRLRAEIRRIKDRDVGGGEEADDEDYCGNTAMLTEYVEQLGRELERLRGDVDDVELATDVGLHQYQNVLVNYFKT